jgi:hypothetical protein
VSQHLVSCQNFGYESCQTFSIVPGDGTQVLQRCGGYTYEQGGLRVRVGEDIGGKEMDGYPLTDKLALSLHTTAPPLTSFHH